MNVCQWILTGVLWVMINGFVSWIFMVTDRDTKWWEPIYAIHIMVIIIAGLFGLINGLMWLYQYAGTNCPF